MQIDFKRTECAAKVSGRDELHTRNHYCCFDTGCHCCCNRLFINTINDNLVNCLDSCRNLYCQELFPGVSGSTFHWLKRA